MLITYAAFKTLQSLNSIRFLCSLWVLTYKNFYCYIKTVIPHLCMKTMITITKHAMLIELSFMSHKLKYTSCNTTAQGNSM